MSAAAHNLMRARVLFANPAPSHEALQDDILAEIAELVGRGAFADGPGACRSTYADDHGAEPLFRRVNDRQLEIAFSALANYISRA